MIHYLKPGRADKNLGKAINDTIKHLPKDDWICVMDIDSMPSYHEKFYEQIEHIATNHEFQLIGCLTNRSGMVEQLYHDVCSQNTDWKHHREIGKMRYKVSRYNVKPTDTTIAGLMMLFPKKVWEHVGGFKEGSIRIDGSFVDWHFCNDVKNAGYKIGIAQGIYMIHMYRPDHINPRGKTKHLEI